MTDRASGAGASIQAEDVPMLAVFLRGYLHEDLVEEHGSASRAFDVFWADAAGDEQQQFQRDWERFTRAIRGAPWPHVRGLLGQLGASWTPATRRAFTVLARAVEARRVPPRSRPRAMP